MSNLGLAAKIGNAPIHALVCMTMLTNFIYLFFYAGLMLLAILTTRNWTLRA